MKDTSTFPTSLELSVLLLARQKRCGVILLELDGLTKLLDCEDRWLKQHLDESGKFIFRLLRESLFTILILLSVWVVREIEHCFFKPVVCRETFKLKSDSSSGFSVEMTRENCK
jgi:hypothetical protein